MMLRLLRLREDCTMDAGIKSNRQALPQEDAKGDSTARKGEVSKEYTLWAKLNDWDAS